MSPTRSSVPIAGTASWGGIAPNAARFRCLHAKRWLEYVEEVIDTAFGLRSSALLSLWLMMTSPGELSRLKLENQGGAYVIPVKLFFVVLIFYGLFFSLSPVRDGQIVVGLNTEFGYEEEGDSWTVEFFFSTRRR